MTTQSSDNEGLERAILEDVEDSLMRKTHSAIIIEHPGGSVRISTQDLHAWAQMDTKALHSYADRLALIVEDVGMILAVAHTDDFEQEDPKRYERRSIQETRNPKYDPSRSGLLSCGKQNNK